MAVILQNIMSFNIYILISGVASLGIGAFLLGTTATSEIRAALHVVNENVKNKAERSRAFKRIAVFVRAHSILMQ